METRMNDRNLKIVMVYSCRMQWLENNDKKKARTVCGLKSKP
jgi:hypothetical protein